MYRKDGYFRVGANSGHRMYAYLSNLVTFIDERSAHVSELGSLAEWRAGDRIPITATGTGGLWVSLTRHARAEARGRWVWTSSTRADSDPTD